MIPGEDRIDELEDVEWSDLPDELLETLAKRYATRVTCPECDHQFWSYTSLDSPHNLDCPNCQQSLILIGG
jgi:uncharacterized paraquat-inducible protein A